MTNPTYSGKRWALGLLSVLKHRLGSMSPSMAPWRHTIPVIIQRTTATLVKDCKAKPDSLSGLVMYWPIAVGARLIDGTHSIMDAEPWVLGMPDLTNNHAHQELYNTLDEMVLFNFGLMYWQLRDCGLSKAKVVSEAAKLVQRSEFTLHVPYRRAMDHMREVVPTLYGINAKSLRTYMEKKNHEYLLTLPRIGKIENFLFERRRILTSLCLALNQAARHEAFVNKIVTENVRKGKLPNPLLFMQRVAEQISTPVTRQQLVDIALLGRVNPAKLWPQFQYAHDLFELLAFAGDHLMALPTPATPELRGTYRREVVGEGGPKPCRPAARPDRAWFADAVSTIFERPILAVAARDLRAP